MPHYTAVMYTTIDGATFLGEYEVEAGDMRAAAVAANGKTPKGYAENEHHEWRVRRVVPNISQSS